MPDYEAIDRLAVLIEQELLMPCQYPTALVPRWEQVFYRVAPRAESERLDIPFLKACCHAYIGDEVSSAVL